VWTNYHCHSNYCDGKGAIEEYVLSAIQKRITALGFTAHSPLPFENKWSMKIEKLKDYIDEIAFLKEKYSSQIQLYTSLEIDFIDGVSGINSPWIKDQPLDYTLCSVHFLEKLKDGNYCEIEGSTFSFMKGLEEIWENDKNEMVKAYFQTFQKMLQSSRPSIIGHLDKIKLHRYPNGKSIIDTHSKIYKEEAVKCLEAIAKTDSFLEINTRAMYKKELEDPYPSIELLQIANELHIPFVLNSDSHQPSELDSCFDTTAALLLKSDITVLKTLHENTWIDARVTKQGLII
jgi:histidinol-phosphatase (PHP family)